MIQIYFPFLRFFLHHINLSINPYKNMDMEIVWKHIFYLIYTKNLFLIWKLMGELKKKVGNKIKYSFDLSISFFLVVNWYFYDFNYYKINKIFNCKPSLCKNQKLERASIFGIQQNKLPVMTQLLINQNSSFTFSYICIT